MTQPIVEEMDEAIRQGASRLEERHCRICGCTEENACQVERTVAGKKVITGCAWVDYDLCDSPSCLQRAGFSELAATAVIAAAKQEEL